MTSATTSKSRRTVLYVVVGVAFALLLVVALVSFSRAASTAAAEDKADQLVAELDRMGLPAPSTQQIVTVLGNDGGAVCDDPNSALKRAVLNGALANGAGGPGTRPVLADGKVIKGELAVLKVYCPEQLPAFADWADGLKLDEVAKGG